MLVYFGYFDCCVPTTVGKFYVMFYQRQEKRPPRNAPLSRWLQWGALFVYDSTHGCVYRAFHLDHWAFMKKNRECKYTKSLLSRR